jgi:hypothetical protein
MGWQFLTCRFNSMKSLSCLLRDAPALLATESEVRG